MGAFRTILACTDFSESGNKAVDTAAAIAREQQASLVLCHVLDPPPTPNPLYGQYTGTEDWSPETQTQVEHETLQALAKLVPAEAGLQVECTAPRGPHADTILEAGETAKADLIVIGTHGYTGLTRLLWGSVAERVARHAKCSVLVVR